MKTSISLLAFLFLPTINYGQVDFSPAGAEWCFSFFGGFPGINGFMHLEYELDTIIENKSCKKLKATNVLFNPNNCCDTLNWIYFVHQSADSVFLYDLNDFRFMFRNDLEQGESITFTGLFNGSLTVEHIDTIMPDPAMMRAFKLSPYILPGPIYIFDRAGPNKGFFDHWEAKAWDGFAYNLHWYRDHEIPVFHLLNQPCGEFLTSNKEVAKDDEIKLWPNPVSRQLILELPEFNVEEINYQIFDLSGKRIVVENKLKFNRKISVEKLPAGFYVLLLEMEGDFFPVRFVKVD